MERISSRLAQISDRINSIIEQLIGVLGIMMATIMGAQVIARYVFNHSLFWSEEVGRIILVWLTFLGSTVAYKRKLHIGIEFFVRKFSPPLRRLCFFVTVVASLVFFLAIILLGVKFFSVAAMYKTAALGIPGVFIYSVIPLSGVVLIIHGANLIMESFRR
ncbi:MAG: TRAP transporter small permease [Thermodesulforhabdaceae bacterium]|jgi:TRAP-type C4-dicarboxylate transport system permease small subunit